jgi:hypothetical protein
MLKISGPIGAALFATIALASANCGFLVDSARADTCAAAPKGAAPAGQHWYYHVDRATRHKCWYLHAAVALPHRAVIRHKTAAAENADAASDPQAAPDPQTAAAPVATPTPLETPAGWPTLPAQTPDSSADNTPPAPHVTVLAVKPSTPFVTTTPAPQQSASDNASTPVVPQASPPQVENTPAVAATKAAPEMAEAAPQEAPQDKADAVFKTPVQTARAATDAARTRTAEEFILLALVLGVAAAVTALISKIVNIYRKPRISVDPDAAWLSYRAEQQRLDAEAGYADPDVPFLDPQEQYGLADLHTQEWLDRPAPQQHRSSILPQQNTKIPAQPPRPSRTDIEPALRALRQARQG